MRWCLLAACSLGLALSSGGCFKPDVKNGGFACSMTDDPPCPQGFFCVGGLCEDHPGNGTEADLSTGTGGNGGGGGGGGGGGTDTDMAHPAQDFAQPAGDMAMAACGMTGADCSSTPCCSSSVCIPGVNICF
ncbi:MAG TPA: hypothetical protein VF334_04565 [Polyangia bacterium]